MTPTETAQYLGVCRTYIYDSINRSKIKVTRIGRKTLICKADIQAMFDFLSPKESKPKEETTEKKGKSISDFYTRAEIREKFGAKDSWIYKVVAENNVPKTINRGKAYFSKSHIDRLFSPRKDILKIQVKQSGNIISRNSAAGYWSTFRALLKLAYKEGWLRENVNDYLDRIDWEEPKINYLEIEEVKRLAATPCKVDVLKRASLFACMTGLRISDILQLRWENIEVSPDGGYCMRIRTQKTKTQATLPLSDEALSYCGEPGHGMVFKGLSRAHTREPFKKWLKDAGIKKKITFHGLRHTYATLLITNGTDIYTVSKMLTHKNVATTQIYAEVISQKKRDAANSITLK